MAVQTLPHISPAEHCRCVVCDAARRERLRELSSSQRRAIGALDPAIPRHFEDLRRRGIRWNTLASLMQGSRRRPALVVRIDLRRALLDAPYYSFAVLTTHGADLSAVGRKAGMVA